MTNHLHTIDRTGRFHGAVLAVATLFGLVFGGAVLLLWAWNAIAVDLFQAPAARFRHAVAVEAVLCVVFATCAFFARWTAHR